MLASLLAAALAPLRIISLFSRVNCCFDIGQFSIFRREIILHYKRLALTAAGALS